MSYVIGALIAGLVGYLYFARRSGSASDSQQQPPLLNSRAEKRVALTENQKICLSCASFDRPIYGENPTFQNAQMPEGAHCFALRTVQSLVKRGFLQGDGKGGYLLTENGALALKSGMGF